MSYHRPHVAQRLDHAKAWEYAGHHAEYLLLAHRLVHAKVGEPEHILLQSADLHLADRHELAKAGDPEHAEIHARGFHLARC